MFRWLRSRRPSPTAPSRRIDDRVSFELRDDELDERRAGHLMTGAPRVTARHSHERQHDVRIPDPEYDAWEASHPNLVEHFEEFSDCLSGKRLAVFLDYDGTLTPIVKNPDEALISEEMRSTVKHLAQLFPTAIISGRGRDKVEAFMQLGELYYAGSHGMDIAGPKVGSASQHRPLKFQPAAKFAPLMDQVYKELTEKFKVMPGATVEHNKFCISAHFRNCPGDTWEKVAACVEETVARHKELRITKGRKVLEIRPQVDWDKGKALDHVLGVLGLKGQSDVVAIYIGDDTTDEDAFKVLRDQAAGSGILVSNRVKATAAVYTLWDPAEVGTFLQLLVQWGRSAKNGWHKNPCCQGWAGVYEEPALPEDHTIA